VDRDHTFRHASAMLSAGGIRQQFSLPANIQLSLYGIEFLKSLGKELQVGADGDEPDVQLREQGYLFLASDAGERVLRNNHATQQAQGVTWTTLLSPDQLADRFPWLNVGGIALGCLGEKNEGWFDPWALLSALRSKAKELGVVFVEGLVRDVHTASSGSRKKVTAVDLELPNGSTSTLDTKWVVNSAGAWSSQIVDYCGPDVASLPVRPRKRFVFSVHCPEEPPAAPDPTTTPLVVDPSGAYFRPEGPPGRFLCGISPPEGFSDQDHEHRHDSGSSQRLEKELGAVDHALFDEVIWPTLYERCAAFGNLKVQSSWAGFYEYNTIDQNGVVGIHPDVENLVLASGFSGHGLQQAPGVGRAVSELVHHGDFKTINLECFGLQRHIAGNPLFEQNIV